MAIKKTKQDNFWNFDNQILKDLSSEGYEGEELLKKFKVAKENIPSAIDKIATDIDSNAKPISKNALAKEIGL